MNSNISIQSFNRLLMIDDNEAIHSDFQKIFERSNSRSELDDLDAELFGESEQETQSQYGIEFKLDFASQGREGFELLKRESETDNPFALAVVDMRMPPGWDAVETIEHLWQVDPDLQVVICTAYSDRSWEEIFGRLGTSDNLLILKKPFDVVAVTQMATSLCEKRRKEIETKKQLETLTAQINHSQSAPDNDIVTPIIRLDSCNQISHWSDSTARIFGISATDAIKKKLTDLSIKWVDPDAVTNLLNSASNENPRFERLTFVDKNEKPHALNLSLYGPQIDHDKHLSIYVSK